MSSKAARTISSCPIQQHSFNLPFFTSPLGILSTMMWSRSLFLLPLLFWTTASEYLKYVEGHSCSGDDQKMIESAWEDAKKLAHWAYKTSSGANYRYLRKRYFGGEALNYVLEAKVQSRYSNNMVGNVTDLDQIVSTLPVSGIQTSSVRKENHSSALPALTGSYLRKGGRNATPSTLIQHKHTQLIQSKALSSPFALSFSVTPEQAPKAAYIPRSIRGRLI
jgi:hypothetical protein